MLDRMLRPQLVYTCLFLSVLLILVGIGESMWGNERGSPANGHFWIIVGAVLVVIFFLLLFTMLYRRRGPRRAGLR